MFKYNNSRMQPLTEESESSSDAQTVMLDKPIHELSGQETAIIARIKRIREIMETLRLKLSVEKGNLARERMEAATLFMYRSIPVNRDCFFPFPASYSFPFPYNYGFTKQPRNPATSIQDYESLIGCLSYGSPVSASDIRYNNFQSGTCSLVDTTNSYKDQLQIVAKMCQVELNKMQESIVSLRKIKSQTKDPSSDENISNILNYDRTDKQLHPKHDKDSQRKQLKIHQRTSRDPNYILLDDTMGSEGHRNHYYHHYRHVPQKRRYLNSSRVFKGESMDEYSGDTTETTNPLCYLDSPYESDID